MKITIKTLDQKTREVDVTQEDTVSDLKLLLEKSTNIPAERQRLIYNARAIDDDRSLREFDGCTLHLVEKPKKRTSDSNTAKEGSKAATTSQISTTDSTVEGNVLGEVPVQSFEPAYIKEVLDLEKRAESVQEHYNAAFKLLDSQFPIPVITRNPNNSQLRMPLEILNKMMELSNCYSRFLPTHSNLYLEMAKSSSGGHVNVSSVRIQANANLILQSMHFASLAFKEISEIKLEIVDNNQYRVTASNFNQTGRHLLASLSQNRPHEAQSKQVPLASIARETPSKDQTRSSYQSVAGNECTSKTTITNEAANVFKLSDGNDLDDTTNSNDLYSHHNISNDESPVQSKKRTENVYRKERLRLRKLQHIELVDDDWRTRVPMDTHEIIGRDLIAQQFTSIQPPYSDAYLSLMPSQLKDEILTQFSDNI